MGLLYGIALRLVNFLVFFLIIIILPGLPPQTTFPYKEFTVTPPKDLKGAFEPNYHLEGAEHLLESRLHGPECLIARQNEVYTGIHGGEVIKLTDKHITHVTKIGLPCEDIVEESRCGRPLGLAFDTQGNNLIIADAYYGIWLVDLKLYKKQMLVSPAENLPGKEINRPAKMFNGVTVDKAGIVYWTDSSSDVLLQDLVYGGFMNPSGRLFKYDRKTNKSQVLLDELNFANGVVISPDEEFLVVAETGSARLTKYYLRGPKTGKSEVFVDGLPGLPDNLTPDGEGIWVPLVMGTDSEHPSAFNMFSQWPHIRMFLARMLNLIEFPFKFLNNIYPNKIAQRFIHFIGHGESIGFLSIKRSTIVRVDWNGNIVGSLHGFDSSVKGISHVLELDDYLLLGSPFNRFLARVKSPKSTKPQKVNIKNVRNEGLVMEPIVEPVTASPTTTTKPKTNSRTTKATTTSTTTSTTTPRPSSTARATTKSSTEKTTTTPQPTKASSKPAKKPKVTTPAPKVPEKPAPVKEEVPVDTQPPKVDKLKVISKEGKHIEL